MEPSCLSLHCSTPHRLLRQPHRRMRIASSLGGGFFFPQHPHQHRWKLLIRVHVRLVARLQVRDHGGIRRLRVKESWYRRRCFLLPGPPSLEEGPGSPWTRPEAVLRVHQFTGSWPARGEAGGGILLLEAPASALLRVPPLQGRRRRGPAACHGDPVAALPDAGVHRRHVLVELVELAIIGSSGSHILCGPRSIHVVQDMPPSSSSQRQIALPSKDRTASNQAAREALFGGSSITRSGASKVWR
mmetsp:Transcript_12396/g.35850  ORF Transcript_12396/g.35850 Transcript_12396/m.35850 type:complete len:244 (-) Transcript_12396:41-772(-)